MAEEDKQNKTEAPTPRKLRQAREKGDVPSSKEVIGSAPIRIKPLLHISTAESALVLVTAIVSEGSFLPSP